jgi:hypothetical protein
VEFVTLLVNEARDARRDMSRAVVLGLTAILGAQLLFALGGAAVLSREQLAGSATPHLDAVVAVFGPYARVWFAVLALVASASLFDTVLASVPCMLRGTAMNGQVFEPERPELAAPTPRPLTIRAPCVRCRPRPSPTGSPSGPAPGRRC